MTTEEKILETMKKAGKAMSAGQIADATGIDRKEVDKVMKVLKTSGKIESPKMCYWQPKK
ncbi:MAG TPA: HTH domain-containing protein [Bacteroidales bacterium]|nr:HTH domain-containing protein [Bacteroidales bacterium]